MTPTNYNSPISIRLDDETKAFYEELAKKDKRKLAEYVRVLLITLREEGSITLTNSGKK